MATGRNDFLWCSVMHLGENKTKIASAPHGVDVNRCLRYHHVQVDSLPYQCLVVKNKTIIGPKSTEEQKVLFIPPQPGVYQCVLSVCSWPVSAETAFAARANIFAKRVVLVAIAQNPLIEVRVMLKKQHFRLNTLRYLTVTVHSKLPRQH